ncbi:MULTISPECIES: hypothetical protein [unclassified Sulfitobacter]|uniref:hypothetical protein n=1 Tax=unclassified Sulfitobacter TaxID=196795 RepID=UPI0023E0EECD|nr:MULTISPECIES: hypothetical protein [unclassified Sulfitobacter]MDF3383380.1 hypothetical protein [Sulfitobacter sp. Ks11]MDF3386799.1 hypothetical protein [Sulfitobacter sp. M85]MDF3390218.1 hypothetical protein [Sulfitobacter sp. Ks16]MDF3400855.1 hypothetical protein [Sulfitobacter sp. KE39]MDF3404276.1 hypothetical protein [Sulfitobacter sp. Ks35]
MKRILASMAGLMGLSALAGQGVSVEVDRAADPDPAPAPDLCPLAEAIQAAQRGAQVFFVVGEARHINLAKREFMRRCPDLVVGAQGRLHLGGGEILVSSAQCGAELAADWPGLILFDRGVLEGLTDAEATRWRNAARRARMAAEVAEVAPAEADLEDALAAPEVVAMMDGRASHGVYVPSADPSPADLVAPAAVSRQVRRQMERLAAKGRSL